MHQLADIYSRVSWRDIRGQPRRGVWILAGMAAFLLSAGILWGLLGRSSKEVEYPIGEDIAGMDLKSLRKQVPLVEARLTKLQEKTSRLLPAGPAILVDSAANQIYLFQNSRMVLKDKCSTGTGFELTDTSGKRTWTFDTPRGSFHVLSKVSHPVWYRPDWAFVEEGKPIPKDRASRAVPDVLGDYALAFGDGFFIHGTLYTRMLGNSVTHGCIRVDDDTLKKLYLVAQPGTPIWIY